MTHPNKHPCYDLYIRRGDKQMMLVERDTDCHVPIKSILPDRKGGMFIQPLDASRVSVYLMSEEIHQVSEFPMLLGDREGSSDVVVAQVATA